MSREKTKTATHKKQTKASQADSGSRQISPGEVIKSERLFDYILICLTVGYFLFYLFKLFSSLENTFFWADENVHAYISTIILKTKSLPAVLPDDIYGGFEYSYPPFFHIIGALAMAIAGFPALKFLNLIILVLFLIGFYALIRIYYGNSEALLACLLISLSPMVGMNSTRFMTEMLSMVLIFGSFFFMVLALKEAKIRFSIISGLSTGLLLLAKQIGFVVLGFYFLLLVWFFFQNKNHVKSILYVIGTAIGLYAPYLIWAVYNGVEVLGFLSVFFETKPEWVTNSVKAFRRSSSPIWEFGYHFYTGNGIVITVSSLIPLYHYIRTRGRDMPYNYCWLMTTYLAGVMIVWHITNARHTITLLPLIAFLFGYSLLRVVSNKIAVRAIIVLLLTIGCYKAYSLTNFRQLVNGPEDPRTIAEYIRKDNSTEGRTLVIQAFDYLMYTGKPVIWPYPNLQKIPLNLFEKQPPDKLYAVLKEYNIGYIVIDTRHIIETNKITIHKYPLSFVRNCEALDRQGKLSLTGRSYSNYFLLLRVN